jgi:hypothetical protein
MPMSTCILFDLGLFWDEEFEFDEIQDSTYSNVTQKAPLDPKFDHI